MPIVFQRGKAFKQASDSVRAQGLNS